MTLRIESQSKDLVFVSESSTLDTFLTLLSNLILSTALKMSVGTLEEIKNRIQTIALDIDRLNEEERAEVAQHLQESLEVLKLGSRVQFENPPVKMETVEVKEEYQKAVTGLYNGLTPTCTECQATFRTLSTLDSHIKQLHPQKYQENLSNSKLEFSRKSKRTVLSPVSPKVEKNMKSPDQSQVPEYKNSEEKLFSCSECEKSFGKISSLKKHKVCHTDRYKCETCGKGFAQNRDIDRHVKIQPGCSRQAEELSRVRGN